MGLVLTVDVGSTNMKGLVVDEGGRVAGKRTYEITLAREGGFIGHDPKELLEALVWMLSYFGRRYGKETVAIVVTTYNHSLLLSDGEGKPLTPVITHHDWERASFEGFLEKVDPYSLYRETGAPPIHIFMPYRLCWFLRNKPDLIRKARYILFCKDYLLWRSGLIEEPYIDPVSYTHLTLPTN